MKRLAIILGVLLLVTKFSSASAADKVSLLEVGSTTLRAQSGQRVAEIVIETQKRRAALYEDEEDATAPERRIVKTISITLNGHKIFVPRTLACGLVLPTQSGVRLGPDISVLTIEGGDTTASYIVRIEFDSNRIRRVTNASPLAPDKPTEVRTYNVRKLVVE